MLGDVFTPVAHPALVLPVLLWGGLTGAKVMLILSAVMAGLAQWWLARVLRVGWLARLWAAMLAVIGGHLWARMEYGTIVITFSIAASSLVFAPLLDLALHGRRRGVLALALVMTSALLSGHGYMQIAILFGALPPLALFLFTSTLQVRPVWRSFGAAALLTILLAAIWWVPLAVVWPALSKSTDPEFALAQKNVIYTLFNLFVADDGFLHTAILGKAAPVSLYSNYIGWVPLALVLAALALVKRREWRVVLYLLLASWLIILTSTTWITTHLPAALTNLLSAGRDPSLMAALAVPPLLGVATLGLDKLTKLPWPTLILSAGRSAAVALRLGWLLPLVALWSLVTVNTLTRTWRVLYPVPVAFPLSLVTTPTAQWVSYTDFFGMPALGVEAGLKLIINPDETPINWGQGREPPPVHLELLNAAVDPNLPGYVGIFDGLSKAEYPEVQYAAVPVGDQLQACQAHAMAGNIDVVCDTATAGVLTVYENNWIGWSVWRDGARVPLFSGNWLQAEAPAGHHVYQFRYRPWQDALGALVTLAGCLLLGALFWRPFRRQVHRLRRFVVADSAS
jgi:hypothetical protein